MPRSQAGRIGWVNGRHYTEWRDELDRLRRDGPAESYERLLVQCVEATERCEQAGDGGVAPAYYERLAVLYRKQGRPADELTILKRYERQAKAPGRGPVRLEERLTKLRAGR